MNRLNRIARLSGGVVASGGSPPVADFEADNTTIDAAGVTPAQFSDLSTNDPTEWHWEYSPASAGTWADLGPTPTELATTVVADIHIPEGVGHYDIRLTATNAFGSDTETKSAYLIVED